VVTVAEKGTFPPADTVAVAGVTATDTTFSGPTLTDPSTALVESAALVATTW
jgi:hypothetical protein